MKLASRQLEPMSTNRLTRLILGLEIDEKIDKLFKSKTYSIELEE